MIHERVLPIIKNTPGSLLKSSESIIDDLEISRKIKINQITVTTYEDIGYETIKPKRPVASLQ